MWCDCILNTDDKFFRHISLYYVLNQHIAQKHNPTAYFLKSYLKLESAYQTFKEHTL